MVDKNQARASKRYQTYREELLSKIPFAEVYAELGLEFTSERPDAKGWLAAKSHEKFGGPDNNPSAAVNLHNGLYKDFRADKTLGIFDFMVEVGAATNWREAQATLAKDHKITLPNISKNSPDYGVNWQEWKDVLARKFCEVKAPITVKGLLRSGAMMCTWNTVPSFAWGIYDHNLHVIGYYFMPRSGSTYSNGAKSVARQMPGTEAGFIGLPAIEAMLADNHPDLQKKYAEDNVVAGFIRNLFWVEGVSDLAAAYSVFPDSVEFVTNPHGCGENLTETQCRMLSNSPLYLTFVSDCDIPGILGAHKRCKQLQVLLTDRLPCMSFSGVVSPFDPTNAPEKHGRDLRDWLSEHADVLFYDPIHNRAPVQMGGQLLFPASTPDHVAELEQKQQRLEDEERETVARLVCELLDTLGIKVLSVEDTGAYVLECEITNKRRKFSSTQRATYTTYLELCGYPFRQLIGKTADLRDAQIADFATFQDYLALRISEIACSNPKLVGKGLWLVDDPDREDEKMLAAVMNGDYYIPTNGQLVQKPGPDCGNFLIDYEDDGEWFDRKLLHANLEEAKDRDWRQSVHDTILKQHLCTWRWEQSDMSVLCAGLLYSTWLQSIWTWRPIVTLVGESNSGKTYLLEMMNDLFFGYAAPVGASTAAGIQQSIGHSAMPLFCDEFDVATEQKKIFKMFRATSRGQGILKGTSTQSGRTYHFHHIPWLSGIQHSTDDQADLNRIISLNLLSVPDGQRTINRPSTKEAWYLGHQIMACVMSTHKTALQYARDLVDMGERSRFRESHAVPFAAMGAMLGLSLEATNDGLAAYLGGSEVKLIMDSAIPDQVRILQDILNSTVRLTHGSGAPVSEPTIGKMLEDPDNYMLSWDDMEPKGLCVRQDSNGWRFLAIDVKTLTGPSGLFAKTQHAQKVGLGTVLRRLSGLFTVDRSKVVRMNGLSRRVIAIDLQQILNQQPT